MANRPGLLSWLRGTLSDLNARAAEQHFETRIDQDIHRAQEEVRLANEQASAARADMLAAQAKLGDLRPRLVDLEEQVVRSLRSRAASRARTLATQVATLSAQVREWEVREAVARQHVEEKRALVGFHESVIQRLRRQLGLRRASINLQRSQEALALFGEPAARNTPARDADIVPPETAQQVLDRLRASAARSTPSVSQSKGPRKAGKTTTKTSTTKNRKGGAK